MVESVGTTTYSYDDAGRMTSLANPYSETTSWTYDDANRVTRQTFSSGAYDAFGYDSRNRQTSVDHKKSDNSLISGESYVYDDAGNLTSATKGGTTTSYTYDNVDQLLTESRTGYSATYTYDANGNRASKTLNSSTDSYSYDDADKLTSVTNAGVTVKSFGYDAAGRTHTVSTSGGTTTLDYDYEGRVTQITYPSSATNTFSYNGLDARVGKVDSAGTSAYKRDGASVTAPVLSDGAAAYTPGISERRSSTSKFYGTDRLGTNTLETNSSQATTATRQYDAFGVQVSSSGSAASPFGYAGAHGYQEDTDSGVTLVGHRYYDQSAGRFLSRDPLEVGRNWYSYCGNNPVRWIDPLGENATEVVVNYLYVMWDAAGKLLKWGVTKNLKTRYTKQKLAELGARIEPVAQSEVRREMLDQERMMVERIPGPLNREPWAGVKSAVELADPTFVSGAMNAGIAFGDAIDPSVKGLQARRTAQANWWMDPDQ
jgi:RHS repeat-associated protein